MTLILTPISIFCIIDVSLLINALLVYIIAM